MRDNTPTRALTFVSLARCYQVSAVLGSGIMDVFIRVVCTVYVVCFVSCVVLCAYFFLCVCVCLVCISVCVS